MACCGDPVLTSTSSTTTVSPPGSDCCLRTRYVCECIDGVDTWVLDVATTECLANNLCVGGESCTDTEYVSEIINGCICLDPLPALPVPTCDPHCCDTASSTTTPPPTTTTTTPPPTTTTTTPPALCCKWDFGAEYNCTTGLWTTFLILSTPDVVCSADTDWTVTGDTCVYQRTMYTVGGACSSEPAPGEPCVGLLPTDCCDPCGCADIVAGQPDVVAPSTEPACLVFWGTFGFLTTFHVGDDCTFVWRNADLNELSANYNSATMTWTVVNTSLGIFADIVDLHMCGCIVVGTATFTNYDCFGTPETVTASFSSEAVCCP